MIRFRHYYPKDKRHRAVTPTAFGIYFTPDSEYMQPTLDLYFGKHVFVIFWSNHR